MFNGEIKNIEDIIDDDILMGPDSKPRRVLYTYSDKSQLYIIVRKRFNNYLGVSNKQILPLLAMTNVGNFAIQGNVVNINVEAFKANKNRWFRWLRSFKVGVDFKFNEALPYDPSDIANYLILDKKDTDKRIPMEYLTASRKDRLDLLANVMDLAGYYEEDVFIIDGLDYGLTTDIVFLANSVGVPVIHKQVQTIGRHGNKVLYLKSHKRLPNKIFFRGDLSEVPCLKYNTSYTKEKKPSNQKVCMLGMPKLVGIYKLCGFRADKDGRFLMGDFSVMQSQGPKYD